MIHNNFPQSKQVALTLSSRAPQSVIICLDNCWLYTSVS